MSTDEIDDFEGIEEAGSKDKPIMLSSAYSVRLGGFGAEGGLISYYSSLTVNQLEDDISLYETLSRDKSWPVSQIIQREVDRIRVSSISKDYILGQGRLVKYFPPLIVAILPRDEDGRISKSLLFEIDNSEDVKNYIFERSKLASNDKVRNIVTKAENISLAKGLYVLDVSKVFDLRILAWDKSKYYAVVIDGQHRLEALIKSKEQKAEVGEYNQDVIFLDMTPLLKTQTDLTPVEVVRRVFVDINTNAKRVGFVRQVLMDDKDLSSLIVQSLVDSADRKGVSKDEDSYLPSQIVDWYGDKLKHSIPHLTGILSLYQIVDDYLVGENISSLSDRRSMRKVNNWEARMNSVFMVDKLISTSEDYQNLGIIPIRQSVLEYADAIKVNEDYSPHQDDDLKETQIFDFDYRVLDVAKARFDEVMLRPFVKFFTTVSPYSKVIEIVKAHEGFNVESELGQALVSSNKKVANSSVLRTALSGLREKIEVTHALDFYLVYTVLGQKVLFNNLIRRIVQGMNDDFDETKCFGIVDKYTLELNSLFTFIEGQTVKLLSKKDSVVQDDVDSLDELGTLATHFWEGIIYEGTRIVYNTQGIRTLSSLFESFVLLLKAREEGAIIYDFQLSEIPYVPTRIKRILKNRFDYREDLLDDMVADVISLKQKFIIAYFSEET